MNLVQHSLMELFRNYQEEKKSEIERLLDSVESTWEKYRSVKKKLKDVKAEAKKYQNNLKEQEENQLIQANFGWEQEERLKIDIVNMTSINQDQ